MTKALIIEDIKKTAELLNQMLLSLFDDLEIVGIANNVKEGIDLIHKQKPEIVFLDINLNKEIGFDILKQTNRKNYEIIVTTAHSEHAIQSIKETAVDFLLKPYDFDELMNAVEKAQKKIELKKQLNQKLTVSKKKEKLSVPTMEGLIFVELDQIIFIQANEGYTEIILQDKSKIVSSKRLTYYEELLDKKYFFRVHKSYLINLDFVKKYQRGRSGCVTMANDTLIPVAENKKKILLDILIN